MIVQATIRYETILYPKPGKQVIYLGEHNPGGVYEISKCWTNQTYCDLVNPALAFCKTVLSAPFTELVVPIAEIEIDTKKDELKKDGFYKTYKVVKLNIVPEDFGYISINKLQDKQVDVVVAPEFDGKNFLEEAVIYQPTVDLKGIPVKYHDALAQLLFEATHEAYRAGFQGHKFHEDWFQETFHNLLP